MALYLVNGRKTLVQFESGNPMALSYPPLPGSRLLSYTTQSVHLMIKELTSELFTIRFSAFKFLKNQVIESMSQKRGIHSRVMLGGDLHYSVEHIGNIHQVEGSVSMIWSEIANCKALFEASKDYRALDFFVSPGIIEQLAYFFPELNAEFRKQAAKLLAPHPCFISPAVKDIVTSIMECPYDEKTSKFYFDLKIREYLYVLLEKHFRPRKEKYNFTPYEVDCIERARELLLSDLTKPPLTIRELSRKAGINEFRLKTGFKHFFGTGVFECFQQARMEKARALLLLTNKPIKELCTLAGYPRMTNFITAFRRHFGYTPGSLRR